MGKMCADLQEYNGNMHKTVHLYLMVLVAALFTYGSQCAAQTDLSGHTQVIQYTDDFSSDKAFHDCWTRSPIWIDGASPPTHPYLIYEEAKNGRSLCFMSPNNETETLSYRLPEAATLSYCLPIDPGNGHPVEPLVLEIEIDVDFLPIENPDGPSAAYLVYYTSADGITWPDQPEATTPGLNRLSFDSLGQNRYIMLRGINARIKTFKTSVYRPPGHILVPDDVPTIQDAIDMSQNGDRIIVADNRYDGPIHFKGKSIYLMSANGPAGCIIDGQSQGRRLRGDRWLRRLLRGHDPLQLQLPGACTRDPGPRRWLPGRDPPRPEQRADLGQRSRDPVTAWTKRHSCRRQHASGRPVRRSAFPGAPNHARCALVSLRAARPSSMSSMRRRQVHAVHANPKSETANR